MNNHSFWVVVGSWGSYNACNSRALGSSWLDLADFTSEDELREELEAQGFELDGIDEELFIQDAEGLLHGVDENADVFALWAVLDESGVLWDEDTAEKFAAVVEVNGFDDAFERARSGGLDDVNIWNGYDLEGVAWEIAQDCYNLDSLGFLANYFDVRAFARDLGFDGFHEYSGGVVELR